MKRKFRSVAALAAFVVVVAACGSDDSSADTTAAPAASPTTTGTAGTTAGSVAETTGDTASSTSTEETDAESESTTATSSDESAPATAGEPASGEPVKIMQILESGGPSGAAFDTYINGLAMRIERLNAEGGFAGRPVEVEVCETKLDPNIATECARNAADDDTFVAVVGSVSQFGEVFVPVLEEAGIPYIGQFPFTPADGTSPVSFPTHAGGSGVLAGVVLYATNQLGAKSVSVGQLGVPGGEAAVQYIESVANANGADVSVVVIPVDRQDLSADVATLSKAAAIIPATTPEQTIAIISTAVQQQVKAPVLASFSAVPPRLLDTLGDAAEGLQLTALYSVDPNTEGHKQMLADAEAAGIDVVLPDDETTTGWVAGELFAQGVAAAASADRGALLDALNGIDSFDTGGLTPVLDYTTPGNALGGAQPRIVNTSVWYAKVEDGAVVPNGDEAVNVFP